MNRPLSVILIGSDNGDRNDLMTVLKALNGQLEIHTTNHLQEALPRMQDGKPDIVILDVKEIESGAREISVILSRCPHAAVFVTTVEKNPDWILRLIRAGASEYLTKPIVATELSEAVKKVARQLAQAKGENVKKGQAIAVYNPSGGMGTTTIAVNLAATFAAQGKKVALMDLNFLSGDVSAFLDLNPRYTLENVTANAERLDANFLATVMASHKSGIDVLSAPVEMEDWCRITPEQIQEVIRLMKTVYQDIIIDTGGTLDARNLATFTQCEHVLFPTILNLPAIKNARRYLPYMNCSGLAGGVKLVINRQTPKDAIKTSDAEKILNTKAFMMIPNGYSEVIGAINRGIPLIACYPKSQVAKAIEELSNRLTMESSVSTKAQRTMYYDAIPAIQFGPAALR